MKRLLGLALLIGSSLANMAQDAKETLQIDTSTGKVINNDKVMQNWKREYAPRWEPKV